MPKFKKYTYVTFIKRTMYNNSIKYYKICSSALKFWTKNVKKSTNADRAHYCTKRYTFEFGGKIKFFLISNLKLLKNNLCCELKNLKSEK